MEKFIVSVIGQRKEVYFDVTDFMKGNDEVAKIALDGLIARHDMSLKILLPKEELMTLQMGLLRLTEAQLKRPAVAPHDGQAGND